MSHIEKLAQEIIKHKNLYYSGQEGISDEEYDSLELELRKLDPDNAALKLVGKTNLGNNKARHSSKMLSLDKTYIEKDLLGWIGSEEVISLQKLDGSSCSLVYESGKLSIAKTRGDGEVGENITEKILHMSIPGVLPSAQSIEVRGEIYCDKKNFVILSDEMARLGLDRPKSLRNIVAGLLGRKENIDLARFLSFRAFELIGASDITKESDKLDTLTSLGFETPKYIVHKDVDSVLAAISDIKDFMNSGEYLVDGIVFIYNSIQLQNEKGETSHHPKYKIAFKFQGDTKVAVIESIQWGVSRNGILTPVANITPVELSGAMISKVTLHNYGQVKAHGLTAGDSIEIVRSGEVIPKFLRLVTKSENQQTFPEVCPCCQTQLKIQDIRLMCLNDNCSEKVIAQIQNYAQEANIEDLSDKRIGELLKSGMVKSIPDLYKLTVERLMTLEKVKDKLAQKLMTNIKASANISLPQFVAALGVEGVSHSKTQKLIDSGIDSLASLRRITEEEVSRIDGFADKSAKLFVESLASKSEVIDELLSLGVNVVCKAQISVSQRLKDKTFCITGELSRPRKEIESAIKENGGGCVGSVSKKTSFLVTNETDASSSKFVKAKELGITVISELELESMITK